MNLSIGSERRARRSPGLAIGDPPFMTKKDDQVKAIGGHLRKLYQHMLAEPLPSDLARLLEKIDKQPSKASTQNKK
jgi:hypothetical protein